MSLSLVFLWKEYRAQRDLLGAYLLLVFPSLMLVFLAMPEHFWLQGGNGAHALGWFFAAGVIGAVFFAAPQLVRAEFTGPGNADQFVRRLPGALPPALLGKLLFLTLVSLLLPLLGLLVGEAFLGVTQRDYSELWQLRRSDNVVVPSWPAVAVGGAVALTLSTWIWAVGTWLPGGRMAVGGACLGGLLLGICVLSVLRQCPGLDRTIASWHWLWLVWPGGLVAAAVSWLRGRRGGDNARSARWGLATTGALLLPPGAWLGAAAHEYHNPDLQALATLHVAGVSPDGRFVIARGAGHASWNGVPVRIDLETGGCEQLGGIDAWVNQDVAPPYVRREGAPSRYWRLHDPVGGDHAIVDLYSGDRTPITFGADWPAPVIPADLSELVDAERRATSLALPGGRRAWVEEGQLHREQPDGSVLVTAWPPELRRCLMFPSGHGAVIAGATERLFDCVRGQVVTPPGKHGFWGVALNGQWLVRGRSHDRGQQWHRFDPDTGELRAAGLTGAFLAVLDDEELLIGRVLGVDRHVELFAWRLRDGRCTPLEVPVIAGATGLHSVPQSRERPWIAVGRHGRDPLLLEVDPDTRVIRRLPSIGGTIFAVGAGAAFVVSSGEDRIERVDTATGARTVLYPRRLRR